MCLALTNFINLELLQKYKKETITSHPCAYRLFKKFSITEAKLLCCSSKSSGIINA